MFKYFITSFLLLFNVYSMEIEVKEKKINPGFYNRTNTISRAGDYGLVMQNDEGSYNINMLNYIYSPAIDVPTGSQVDVDFLVKGDINDLDPWPEVDIWGLQVKSDDGPWYYVSNPYGLVVDDNGDSLFNYVYSDAPETWSLFSNVYSTPIDISNYAGSTIQLRYWFSSDDDNPDGEGLFFDDITVSVDGENIYVESFEDSTMLGWVSEDRTAPGPAWHIDDYGAYGGSGSSWWMGDPTIGANGGYLNMWYQVLDTPPVQIPSTNESYSVKFDQKRLIEGLCSSNCWECDDNASVEGWDAFNVRISSDGGDTWDILNQVTPLYNAPDTYSFGYNFSEGCDIPGWGGSSNGWESTEFIIPQSYNGQEIIVRFAFSSDIGYDTESNNSLTGVFIDNIDIARVFQNNGEDSTGFVSASLVTEGSGDLWHVGFIGVPPVVPTPQNIDLVATDGSVELNWQAPTGNTYSDEWVSFDDGNFDGYSIVLGVGGQGYLGNMFDLAYGIETATVHFAKVHTSGSGQTTLAGFSVENGIPDPAPSYTTPINVIDNDFSQDIELGWEFDGSFVIALLVKGPSDSTAEDGIGISLDRANQNGPPSSNSWSNLAGWSLWREIAQSNENVSDGEFGIHAKITTTGGSEPSFNVYRNPGVDGSYFQLMEDSPALVGNNNNFYIDTNIDNGTEYCYKIQSVYDDQTGNLQLSEQTTPLCGIPISTSVYEVAYDDGSSEQPLAVGNGSFAAMKITPTSYPSILYGTSIYVDNVQNAPSGSALIYVWKDDGLSGGPGTVLTNDGFGGILSSVSAGWNDINFVNSGQNIIVNEGSIYIGYRQLNINFSVGLDLSDLTHSSNSFVQTEGGVWSPLSSIMGDGVMMIRAQFDNQGALNSDAALEIQIPNKFTLSQNYPNPFNPSTIIQFGLKYKSTVTLKLFNILGSNVKTVLNTNLDAGYHKYEVSMNGFPSGVYFYRLDANSDGENYSKMKKMILMR